MKTIGIIPSRLQSTRVPRKPLVDICGLPMCVHVYRRALLCADLDELVIATDSDEVVKVATDFGCNVQLTSSKHRNGTERMAEVLTENQADIAILINGDEALVNPDHISVSLNTLLASQADASILVRKYTKLNSPSDFKIVLNLNQEVMYISRSDIPSSARNIAPFMLKAYHVMAFHRHTIQRYARFDKTPVELIEDHEHLRLLEHGFKIRAEIVESESVSVDTQEDLDYVRRMMLSDPFWPKYR